MIDVVPAIIPRDKKQLEDEMALVSKFASRVQVDICDGIFVPVKTWPYNTQDVDYFEQLKREEVGWPEWEHVDIEVHLMVAHPERIVLDWIDTGVTMVVAHVEATEDFQELIDVCRAHEVGVGIAIKPGTDISSLAPFVEQVDYIQVMGSQKLGHHGVPLDPSVVTRISELRTLYGERIIGVDIGVTEDTAPELVSAGARKLIIGSAILDADDPEESYLFFKNLE
jgi:ribulose-phosphate 3-epimerase